MPNVPKTPTRPIRIPDAEWADFGEATKLQGADRSAAVRDFIGWYLRRPGVKLPTRPTAEELAAIEADRYGVDLER